MLGPFCSNDVLFRFVGVPSKILFKIESSCSVSTPMSLHYSLLLQIRNQGAENHNRAIALAGGKQ